MSYGPGRYASICNQILLKTKADAVILMVCGDKNESGFEVQGKEGVVLNIPGLLRAMADSIEQDEQQIRNS